MITTQTKPAESTGAADTSAKAEQPDTFWDITTHQISDLARAEILTARMEANYLRRHPTFVGENAKTRR